MRILHLAAGNRWTGAAAPALAEVEALRAAGVEARFAYIGGHNLESRVAGLDFTHPAIDKAQNPISFTRSLARIGRLIEAHSIDVLHAHLTYDHWLAGFAARKYRLGLVRTFHSHRTLRGDPISRGLVHSTGAICIVNDTFATARLIAGRNPLFTPPPLDERLFASTGPTVRAQYGIGPRDPVVAVIGKIAKRRGFEEALQTFAWLYKSRPDARLMIIGHGEHRGTLEALSHELDIAPRVIWAGYHEADLADHYRAADLLLFTAPGSDEGHRAIIEAMACGVTPATFPIAGVGGILGSATGALVADAATPAALARLCNDLLARSPQERDSMRRLLIAHARAFAFTPAASRLIDVYSRLVRKV